MYSGQFLITDSWRVLILTVNLTWPHTPPGSSIPSWNPSWLRSLLSETEQTITPFLQFMLTGGSWSCSIAKLRNQQTKTKEKKQRPTIILKSKNFSKPFIPKAKFSYGFDAIFLKVSTIDLNNARIDYVVNILNLPAQKVSTIGCNRNSALAERVILGGQIFATDLGQRPRLKPKGERRQTKQENTPPKHLHKSRCEHEHLSHPNRSGREETRTEATSPRRSTRWRSRPSRRSVWGTD